MHKSEVDLTPTPQVTPSRPGPPVGLPYERRVSLPALSKAFSAILTPEAIKFVVALEEHFSTTREELLLFRIERQRQIDAGAMPVFLPATAHVREKEWQVAPIPRGLLNRRVEITGPAGDTKMVINALNSGANVFMADFEDAQSPTWENTIQGQVNLRDAVAGKITHTSPDGKHYRLNEKIATLMMRPRGWHLHEKHVSLNGKPVSASLFDFGLFAFHNAATLSQRGAGPYFYLPKLESHLEARLWNDVFLFAERELDIPPSTFKATVLIETILAAFEMDEILYELREHAAGLNCGRWDYIFSVIKKFRTHPGFILPDRASVTMDKDFLASYVRLLIRTCHRRGAHAMGGMAAQIPIKDDTAANAIAIAKVRADKEREALAGHDGTWVAHPGLVGVAKEVFDQYLAGENQIGLIPDTTSIAAQELLDVRQGVITERGLRTNIDVGIQYLEAWLRGVGAVPLYNLMEDAATAEICRAQVWQWLRHGATLSDGRVITSELVRTLIEEELSGIQLRVGDAQYRLGRYPDATELFKQLALGSEFPDFLTLAAYNQL